MEKKPNITPRLWYIVDNFATEDKHDIQIAVNVKKGSRQVAQMLKRNYSLENDLPTLDETKANAQAIVTAVNCTYGANINPEKIQKLLAASANALNVLRLYIDKESIHRYDKVVLKQLTEALNNIKYKD